jgi:hypothetical protein
MSSTAILKAAGLNTSPNELSVPEGSLSDASNILIRRDGIVEKRRGFKLYGTAGATSTDRVKQLSVYQGRILRHITDTLEFDSDGSGTFQAFDGNYLEADSSLRMKFIESNGNLYFTSSNGIQKLAAKSASTLSSSSVSQAGGIKALDLTATLVSEPNLQTGFFPQDSAISYRVVWGYKDVNGNLILGSPSQQAVLYNYQINLMLQDYMRMLGTFDSFSNTPLTTARINDKNYVSTLGLTSTASVSDLRANLILLAKKLDTDILYADGSTAPITIGDDLLSALTPTGITITGTGSSNLCRITFTGTPSTYLATNSNVILNNFVLTGTFTGSINGNQTLTNATTTYIEFYTSATLTGTISTSVGTVTIPAITISNGICTVIRKRGSTGNFSDYLSSGTQIYLTGSTAGINTTNGGVTGTLDGAQVVVGAYTNYITFNVSTTGTNQPVNPVTVATPSINSNTFRAISQPAATQIPPLHIDNVDVQTYMSDIITAVKVLPTNVVSTADQALFDNVDLTTTANVNLNITIPQGITSSYFYQVYRSSIFSASDAISISDIIPNDELQLVYEAYPTSAQITAGTLSVEDITPDAFKGANLYTNNSTGEGILQANEQPPFALDINRYRNVVFYANTRTKHSLALNLLGVQNMITDYNNGITPSITIATASGANTYKFVTGLQEITQITTVADVSNSLNSKYFLMDSTTTKYYFYFETTTAIDPAISGRTGVKVNIATNATADQVATALQNKLLILLADFTITSVSSTVLKVTNVGVGPVSPSIDGPYNSNPALNKATGFTIVETQAGRGENAASKTVLLSTNVSPSVAVDQTARSLVRVINSNVNESVYGFYLSGSTDVPGKIELEARSLDLTNEFFVTSNNSVTGLSFNPAVSPDAQITSITTGSTPIITTSTPHGLENLDFVLLANTNTTPSIDGVYTITYIDSTHFSIAASPSVTVAGTLGSMSAIVDVLTSDNEVKPNRVYFSKFSQPEAVPVVNYFDVGAQDKAILRIMPLRDSLFVFKEDGLYRISGDTAPFQLNLFDSSFNVIAPDSVAVSNNIIYSWTNQGLQNLSEGGAGIVSRPIDNQILKLGSNNYTNFKTVTWGVGYESDNSYIVWTNSNTDDTVATIGYRYSTQTKTWTTYDKTNTCGIVSTDDRLYLGAGDTNYVEQERKSFDRTDYADREFITSLADSFLISPTEFKLASLTGIGIGDVIVQDQKMTIYLFNLLLGKLDLDNGIAQKDFAATLTMVPGDNPRDKILALATKLDSDSKIVSKNFLSSISDKSGTITAISAKNPTVITSNNHGLITGRTVSISGSNCSPSINNQYQVTVLDSNTFTVPVSVKTPGTTGTFETVGLDVYDLETNYNKICDILNADTSVSFTNYKHIQNDTMLESVITDLNQISKHLFINAGLQYMVGNITVYKAIPSTLTYSPISMGDPLSIKHLRESTIMFQHRNITEATLSFATDLLPEFISVDLVLDGNGIFGSNLFGNGFFGGASNSAPCRTYVPRQCQRCRFVVVKFEHAIAREDYKLLGITITGEVGLSVRGYR